MSDASTWEAPAKLNLSLEVRPRDSQGLHPLRSLAQTIEWCDILEITTADGDSLTIDGAELPDNGDNLIWKAVDSLRREMGRTKPPLAIRLQKRIAVAAGLGGGSSDAAATLLAVADNMHVPQPVLMKVAPEVGADVALFLKGGIQWMEGYGERLSFVPLSPDYSVAVAVPAFELSTGQVYETWDKLDSPVGRPIAGRGLPPSLRDFEPLRNDLTPAAMHIRPELGDWIEELTELWERPVLMTGSGPALFGFFADLDEAASAAKVSPKARAVRAAMPRSHGVRRLEDGESLIA
jgi:4-diphosphocytidyl-2-C-methyl-D-erythritol kinase